MNSLFVDKRGIELRVDNNALTIYEKNLRVSTIPLAPIKRIFLQGDVQLSASVLAKLGDYQIGVVVLYGYKAQPTLLMPTYSKDAQRRQAQYKTSLDPLLSLSYARLLVAQKLQGHVIILQEMASLQPKAKLVLGKAIQRIEGINGRPLHQCTSVETLRGLEGAAAACYFEALAHVLPDSIGFDGRNRRPPKDPFNALLSLGYALLHSEAVLAIHAAGLDPHIGFYHTVTHGRESLACDLVEPLRHHIDHLCWRLVTTQVLRKEDFSQADTMCQLNKAGRVRFYQSYETLLGSLRKKMWQQMRELGQLIEGKPFEFEAVLLSELEG